jgi:hypothetical protein
MGHAIDELRADLRAVRADGSPDDERRRAAVLRWFAEEYELYAPARGWRLRWQGVVWKDAGPAGGLS